jgi:hypothetical protein
MKFRFTTYFVLRKRLVKFWLKQNGWKFRGQDPPNKWKHIIFLSPAKDNILKSQNRWMKYLTASPSSIVEISNKNEIERLLYKKHTVLIRWSEDICETELVSLLKNCRDNKVRISACAWDTKHKAIKFHSQFKASNFPERDIRYLGRFFIYFKQI